MLKPRALRPNDRLSVIAPASPFERDLFEQGLAELRDLSFEPVYEPSVFYKREYVAGDPATRAEAFMRAQWRVWLLQGEGMGVCSSCRISMQNPFVADLKYSLDIAI